jgi:hypothetical protein
METKYGVWLPIMSRQWMISLTSPLPFVSPPNSTRPLSSLSILSGIYEEIEIAPEKAPKQKVIDDCSVTVTHLATTLIGKRWD